MPYENVFHQMEDQLFLHSQCAAEPTEICSFMGHRFLKRYATMASFMHFLPSSVSLVTWFGVYFRSTRLGVLLDYHSCGRKAAGNLTLSE